MKQVLFDIVMKSHF